MALLRCARARARGAPRCHALFVHARAWRRVQLRYNGGAANADVRVRGTIPGHREHDAEFYGGDVDIDHERHVEAPASVLGDAGDAGVAQAMVTAALTPFAEVETPHAVEPPALAGAAAMASPSSGLAPDLPPVPAVAAPAVPALSDLVTVSEAQDGAAPVPASSDVDMGDAPAQPPQAADVEVPDDI